MFSFYKSLPKTCLCIYKNGDTENVQIAGSEWCQLSTEGRYIISYIQHLGKLRLADKMTKQVCSWGGCYPELELICLVLSC